MSLLLIGGAIALILNANSGDTSPPPVNGEAGSDGTSKPDRPPAVITRSTSMTPLAVARNAVPVFILAGQTNMTGAGSVPQLESLIKDDETRPKYAELVDAEGDFRIRKDVWLVTPEGASPLTAVSERHRTVLDQH